MLFLIDYDRRNGLVVKMESFKDSEQDVANASRLALEITHVRAGIEREVVLLEASSEEALRRTHRRYFEKWETLASTG